jgi:hypothetical protein
MRLPKNTYALLFIGVVLAATAVLSAGNTRNEDASMQQAAEIPSRNIPPLDREVPEQLETAVFGLG